MITEERKPSAGSGAPPQPPSGIPPWWPWWRLWPTPRGRPQPVNRRSLVLGALVTIPALFFIDGLLSGMAWYATKSVLLAVILFAVLFCFTFLELALVAYVTKRRQEYEARHAPPED
ncbi:MAG TPA: hypothetical protein VF137_09820 [Candidatus Dormibacteraeota bacterium]